jgi:hypothetical protein
MQTRYYNVLLQVGAAKCFALQNLACNRRSSIISMDRLRACTACRGV